MLAAVGLSWIVAAGLAWIVICAVAYVIHVREERVSGAKVEVDLRVCVPWEVSHQANAESGPGDVAHAPDAAERGKPEKE